MNDTQSILQEELFIQNNTATLFHRTRDISSVPKILKSGWSTGGGSMYGVGVYTTYILNDQFRSYMERYGNVLVKFKYTGLDKLLCFSPDVAKQVHKDKHLLIDQINKLVPNHGLSADELKIIENIQTIVDKATYSSEGAKRFVDTAFFPDLHDKLNGIEYHGANDGHCVVIYPPGKGIELISYVSKVDTSSKNIENLKWVSVGTKKTFSKVFSKGIFIQPDVELPMPNKVDEKVPFMEFIKKLKEKNTVVEADVKTLFEYSFNTKTILGIFEKLNINFLTSDACVDFFLKFLERNDISSALKVLEITLNYKPGPILEQLVYEFPKFTDNDVAKIILLLFDTNLSHLGTSGLNKLLDAFSIIFSRIKSKDSTKLVEFKNKLRNYIIEHNLIEWVDAARYSGSSAAVLIASLFDSIDVIEKFITQAKQDSNFNLNKIIPFIAIILSKIKSTDDDFLKIIELLKNYPNSSQFLNATQGPIAYRVARIYLRRNPEKITPELLSDIISTTTEDNVDDLANVNPATFKAVDQYKFFQGLIHILTRTNNEEFVNKIWKYALLSPIDQESLIEILTNLFSDAGSGRTTAWIVWFKNIVKTYVLTPAEVKRIIRSLRYPADTVRDLVLTEFGNLNQFEEAIFYIILDSVNLFDTSQLIKWCNELYSKIPDYINKIITKPEFANHFLNETYSGNTDLVAHLYMDYNPQIIETLPVDKLKYLLIKLKSYGGALQNVYESNLVFLYTQSDSILNKADSELQQIIFSKSPILDNNKPDIQSTISVYEKIAAKNPNFINEISSYYWGKLYQNSKNAKYQFIIEFLLKYKNVNLKYNDIYMMFDMQKFAVSPTISRESLINQILEIKKDTLDDSSINVLFQYSYGIDPQSMIELLKKYNSNYLSDIGSYNWTILIERASEMSDKNPKMSQYIEDVIFSLPTNINIDTTIVKQKLIEYSKNKEKTIRRFLDSDKFTLNNDLLTYILKTTNNIYNINKIIGMYKFDIMDGKELARIYDTLLTTDDDYKFIFANKKTTLRLFLNQIANRINALDDTEKNNFLSYAMSDQGENPLIIRPYELVAMRGINISLPVFKKMLYVSIAADPTGQGPFRIIKKLLKYNNTAWHIDHFFNALNDKSFISNYNYSTGNSFDINKMYAYVLTAERNNLTAPTLKAMLNSNNNAETKKKIIDIVLKPDFKGLNLDSNDVFVILGQMDVINDESYKIKTILTILRLVNEKITDNMIVNIMDNCPAVINNKNGPEYIANRIILYRKNNLTESAIYNLIRFMSTNDAKIRIINQLITIKQNNLTANDIYHIIASAPVNGLKNIINQLLQYNASYKDYIIRILNIKGLDINTILAEMRRYKKYYNF